mgnify:CR=1 FL=1
MEFGRVLCRSLDRVRVTEKLVKLNPGHIESLVVLARASLDARLWGEARQALEKTMAAPPLASPEPPREPSGRVCRMMAELEENENGDSGHAREWLVRATQAGADPVWVCDHCGNGVGEWSVTCGKCGEFDTYYWRPPPSVAGLMEPSVVDGETEGLGPRTKLIDGGGAAILPPGGVGAG